MAESSTMSDPNPSKVVVREVTPWLRVLGRVGAISMVGVIAAATAVEIAADGLETETAVASAVLVVAAALAFAMWRALGIRTVLEGHRLRMTAMWRERTVELAEVVGMHDRYTRGNESDHHVIALELAEGPPLAFHLGGLLAYPGWPTLAQRLGEVRRQALLDRVEAGDDAFFGVVSVRKAQIEVDGVEHPLETLREVGLGRGVLSFVFDDEGWNVKVDLERVADRYTLMGLLSALAPHVTLPTR